MLCLTPIPRAIPVALLLLLLLAVVPGTPALAQDGRHLLIRNAVLADPTGQGEDRTVNLLVEDDILKVITEDKIGRDEADEVFNARGGFLVGKLEIGEPANFMILTQDPRENFEVMLDTRVYGSFAIHDGDVVRNRLQRVFTDDPEDEPQKQGWLAYTPPPLAVPINYQDTSSLLHLGIGYRWSDAKEGFRYRTEPEFNKSLVFVDTAFGQEQGMLPADQLDTWTAELAWRRGPIWLASEYTRTDVHSEALGDPTLDGWWVGLSWILTGEMRAYNPKSGTFGGVPVSRSVYQGGPGAWEASLRFSNIDLEDQAITGGEMDIGSLGMTWWASPFLGVNANYRYIWNTLEGVENTTSGINLRLMLILE